MRLGGWCVMLTGMILFLTIAGVTTSFTSILTDLGLTEVEGTAGVQLIGDVGNSPFWDALFEPGGLLLGLIASTAVAIGLFMVTKEISILLIPFLIFIGQTFIGTFWSVVLKVNAYGQWWMTSITTIIFTALAVGFIMSLFDYFGGRQ